MTYLWKYKETEHSLARNLAEKTGMPFTVVLVLMNRGFNTPESIKAFFNTNLEDMYDPFLMKDMEKAVDRTTKALFNQERVTIFGDYDVDGTTSTALLQMFLSEIGLDVNYYIPDREREGYGLSKEGIDFDVTNDEVYNFGFYTDGRWTNQQIGKYQQAFVIFNLPDNATLEGMDSDGDGLNDKEELYTYYTNPKMADTDEDLREDGAEVTLGYDPLFWTSVTTAPVITTPVFGYRAEYNDSPKIDLNVTFNYTDADGDNGTAMMVWYQGSNVLYTEEIHVTNGSTVTATIPAEYYDGGYNLNATVYAVDDFGGISNSEYVNQTIIQYEPQGDTLLLDLKPAGTYTDTTWMLEFGLDGGSVPAYDDACGVIVGTVLTHLEASTKGAKALSYSAEGSAIGYEEKQRFDLTNFPQRFYSNTYRIFFEVNETLAQDVITQVDINVTDVLSRQGSPTVDTDTYRLYRINKNGGIYNDTGLCYEQPVKVG